MYLVKEDLTDLIKDLGYIVISKNILVSNTPIPALAFLKDRFFFIEHIKDRELGFIVNHFKWIDSNRKLLKSKFKLKNITDINLLCISFIEGELNMEISGFKGKLDCLKFSSNEKREVLSSFKNWTLNRCYLKNRLKDILPRILKEDVDFINNLLSFKPLFIKEKFKDYFVIQSSELSYRLIILKDFIWLHGGKAPFRPRKILIKS